MKHACTPLSTRYGRSEFHCFSFGEHEEDNLLVADCRRGSPGRVLLRVQSACYTAEIFRSTDCDCHEQLDTSLERIHAEGGVLVYMLADGRGAGLLTKVRGLALGATEGLDTFDAYMRLGVETDPRTYDRVAQVLNELGIDDVILLTNNPRKIDGLKEQGLTVERAPLQIAPTDDSAPYLATKRSKMGHLLNE